MTQRVRIRITSVSGAVRWWHKAGRVHTLAPELATVWPAHFQPALFQVLPDGHLVPRGTAGAEDVVAVEAVPDVDGAATPVPS